jgi:hypothetical protein
MARGIKKNPNRKEVRNVKISIRLNEYELDSIMTCLDILKDDRPISIFIRDTINDKVKEMSKEIDKT